MKILKQVLFVAFACCVLLLVSCDDSDRISQETGSIDSETKQDNIVDNNLCQDGHTEIIDEKVAPTCTETGLTEGKHCSVCDTVLVKQEILDASGHTEVTDSAISPTCTSIGGSALDGCSNLTTINYNGTKEQWNTISKGSYWDENTGNYVINCTDGTVTKE